jgi:hypothetical protein
VEKEKEKEISSLLGWGKGFWPTPGASARAGALTAQRAHSSARAEGEETALRPDGVGEPAERGRRAGRWWARRRFAAGGPVLGPREGGLAWAEAGDSKGRLNSARGGWEGLSTGRWRSSAAGITAGGL